MLLQLHYPFISPLAITKSNWLLCFVIVNESNSCSFFPSLTSFYNEEDWVCAVATLEWIFVHLILFEVGPCDTGKIIRQRAFSSWLWIQILEILWKCRESLENEFESLSDINFKMCLQITELSKLDVMKVFAWKYNRKIRHHLFLVCKTCTKKKTKPIKRKCLGKFKVGI